MMKMKQIFFRAVILLSAVFVCTGAGSVRAYAKQKEKAYESRSESLIRVMEPYRAYGLAYNAEQDELFFNGQAVKAFVDVRQAFPNGGYSFNVGYFDDQSSGKLYLEAAHDANGKVIGIVNMPEEIKNDLYGEDMEALPEALPGLADEIRDNLSEQKGTGEEDVFGGDIYVIFNATTYLLDGTIMATDKIEQSDIPSEVSKWITAAKGAEGVQVKRTTADGKTDVWVYYGSMNRLAWKLEAVGTTLQLTLKDNPPEILEGATLIHYQAPAAYQGLDVTYKNEKLVVNG